MEIVSKIALITINETTIAQIVSFLIFIFILNRIMIRPLLGAMGDREDYINELQSTISGTQKEMERLQADFEVRESSVKKEAMRFNSILQEEGTREAETIHRGAMKEIETIKEAAHKEVNTQIADARNHLSAESEILAVSIMEKVLDRRVSP